MTSLSIDVPANCELSASFSEGDEKLKVIDLAGTKLKLNGRLEEGYKHYQRAIAACPAYAPAFYNIGVIHSERRDFGVAKQYYERALQVGSPYLSSKPNACSANGLPMRLRCMQDTWHKTSPCLSVLVSQIVCHGRWLNFAKRGMHGRSD